MTASKGQSKKVQPHKNPPTHTLQIPERREGDEEEEECWKRDVGNRHSLFHWAGRREGKREGGREER